MRHKTKKSTKLPFEHFVLFCLLSALGVEDILKKGFNIDPTLEAVDEYFADIRRNSRSAKKIEKHFRVFIEEHQIKEFYEKVYMSE